MVAAQLLRLPPAGGRVPGASAEIERGQRGGYGWELRANVTCQPGPADEAALSDAITALRTADMRMGRLFGAPAEGDSTAGTARVVQGAPGSRDDELSGTAAGTPAPVRAARRGRLRRPGRRRQ